MSAISFDADGTLWDFDAVMRRALRVVLDEVLCRWPGPDTAALTVDEMIAVRNTVAARNSHDWSRLEDIRREAFAVTLQQIRGADVDAADVLNELYLRHRFDGIELFDDVIECLDQLDGDYPIGLLSNGNNYPDGCGLDGRFAFTVFAQDHGIAKPDPRLFHIAAAEAGCPINELVHAGDGQTDIEGAVLAGCRSVLIDRANLRPPHAAQANHVITDLRQLPSAVHALSRHWPRPKTVPRRGRNHVPAAVCETPVAERADRGRDSSWSRCSDVRRRRRALRSWATEGEAVARRREVHKSTHAAAPTCLSAPLYASRYLSGGQGEMRRLRPDSRSFGPESTLGSLVPAVHEALLRNEGADGSNPFTSTTKRPVAPATGRFR